MKSQVRTLLVVTQLVVALLMPLGIHAQTQDWKAINPKCVAQAPDGQDVATLTGVECLVSNVLSIGVSAVGISAFVMLVVGSVMHLTSGGEPRKAETANKTMTYAIAAILLSVTGWIVINFVSTFTGVTTFQIFQLSVPTK